MKLSFAAFALAMIPSAAFTTRRAATGGSALFSTIEPPERTAPDAGYMPEWEDREGLSPEEFIASDMSKPDLSGMWECPLTRWDTENVDLAKAQRDAKKVPHCPLEIRASAKDNEMGAEYFVKNQQKIRKELLKHGAIWFRGFDLMKSVKGNREMHEALALQPCLDPLHSSGLRKFASERDALYEEVRYANPLSAHSVTFLFEFGHRENGSFAGAVLT